MFDLVAVIEAAKEEGFEVSIIVLAPKDAPSFYMVNISRYHLKGIERSYLSIEDAWMKACGNLLTVDERRERQNAAYLKARILADGLTPPQKIGKISLEDL